ncbi:MAG: cbb3-type cytochrome c oxidase subunit I [Parvularculaceae bacterium]
MFGRLTWEAIPTYSAVALSGAAVTVLGAVAIVVILTYFKLWKWLYVNWLTTVDHKKIGVMYIILAFIMLLRGFADGIMMRAQQMMAIDGVGYLTHDHFQQVFTAHGTIMIFFVATPFFSGLANFILPQQLGSRDVAFPFMNAVSFWLTAAGAVLVLISLAIGEFSTAGWTGYPPYSGVGRSPGVGVDYWIWSLFISGWGTTLTGINFAVTITRRRAPGMTLMKMPIFVWTVLCSSIIIMFAFPALTVDLVLLMGDRLLGTHFFTAEDGGNFMNFANIFWMWGHPEVYLLVLPAFGIYSEVVATFSGKPIFGYKTMVQATVIITVVSMMVWLHHFFTMGSSATVNAIFGIATMIIGIPTGMKIFNWLFTMYRGKVRMHSTMYWAIGFMVLFMIGGATGVMHAIVPLDYNLHNTTFLVAHFHNVLIPGVLFGYIAGYQYWFPKAFGFTLDERWGKLSFWGWAIGFTLVFTPLYILGLMGLPRRTAVILDSGMAPLLYVSFIGALVVFFGIFALGMQLYVSIKNRNKLRDTTGDPWDGRTLEWSIPSPTPEFNFARVPVADELDIYANRKRNGKSLTWGELSDIEMPNDTICGFLIGAFSFLLGFGFIWWMWWMAFIGFVGIIGVIIFRSFIDHAEHEVSVDEIREALGAHPSLGEQTAGGVA